MIKTAVTFVSATAVRQCTCEDQETPQQAAKEKLTEMAEEHGMVLLEEPREEPFTDEDRRDLCFMLDLDDQPLDRAVMEEWVKFEADIGDQAFFESIFNAIHDGLPPDESPGGP